MYMLRIATMMTPITDPKLLERHTIHSDDGNILMRIAGDMHRNSIDFASAILHTPDGHPIAYLSEDGSEWESTKPATLRD